MCSSRLPPCEGQYGTFPHLAKGAHTSVAKRMKAGFAALAADRRRRRGRPRGAPRPPVRPQRSDARRRPSPRLDPIRALARERDIEPARDFYRLGPRRLRALRLRHGLPDGPGRRVDGAGGA